MSALLPPQLKAAMVSPMVYLQATALSQGRGMGSFTFILLMVFLRWESWRWQRLILLVMLSGSWLVPQKLFSRCIKQALYWHSWVLIMSCGMGEELGQHSQS